MLHICCRRNSIRWIDRVQTLSRWSETRMKTAPGHNSSIFSTTRANPSLRTSPDATAGAWMFPAWCSMPQPTKERSVQKRANSEFPCGEPVYFSPFCLLLSVSRNSEMLQAGLPSDSVQRNVCKETMAFQSFVPQVWMHNWAVHCTNNFVFGKFLNWEIDVPNF